MKCVGVIGLGLAWALAIAPVAAKDHDKGKHESPQAEQQQGHFDEHDRAAVRGYYENAVGRGHCPPGLAKKNNGCLPPGQAKKLWAVGRPLPPSVVYAPAPPALVVQLTPPPVGYRYIQVSGDILLIAAGSRMVADAITDLGR